MNMSGQRMEQVVRGVLMSLWRRPEGTMQGVLQETGTSVSEMQEALRILVEERKCVIERGPTTIRLVSTGIRCWGDVVEGLGLRVGKRVRVYLKTSSTNDVAWQFAGGGAGAEDDGVVVVAEEQTAGRGRLGREWLAKGGQGVLMSVLLREEGEVEGGIERLTLLAGLAAAEGIEKGVGGGLRAELKWPNDVLVGGRKIAGVLVERRRVGDVMYAVVGIGVNVGQGSGDFAEELAGRATSIYQVMGMMVDRLRVVVGLVESLDRWMGDRHLSDDWLVKWKGRCVMLGTRVEARVEGGGMIRGMVVDVDPLRGLVLRDEGGGMHFLRAQTTTLSV